MKSQKKSLVVLITSLFWVGYVSITIGQYISDTAKFIDKDIDRRRAHVEFQLFLAAPFLATDDVELMKQNLEMAHKMKEFDFYLLKKDSTVLAYKGATENYKPEVLDPFHQSKGWQSSGDGTFMARTLAVGEYKLTLGVTRLPSEFILNYMLAQKWDLARDIALVTLLVLALLYFNLKDIIDLTNILRTKSRRGTELIKVRTREAETLVNVTSEFERVAAGLRLENETISETLSPAIREEINTDTPVGTAIDCCVVRVDLNGYTQSFLDKKEVFMSDMLNRYFQAAGEIIERYGGLIYQYVGDEIVFHIKMLKGEPEGEAARKALGCVRGIFEIADRLDEEFHPQGVPFKVKASFVTGQLRFVKLDRGYAFSGLPLIESVRMLGKIDEKKENVLAFYSSEEAYVKPLCKIDKHLRVSFKGFREKSEISEVKEFVPMNKLLKDQNQSLLALYRSDTDLETLLTNVSDTIDEIKVEDFMSLYKALRETTITRVGGGVAKAYERLLEVVSDRADRIPELTVILASVINLGSVLLRAGAMNVKVRKLLESHLKHPDQRVRGNAIMALDELSPETYSFREMFSQPYNRAAADALIAEGRRDYCGEVHSFLKTFLSSNDPFFVASGLYVMAYLYNYHRDRDPVYFKANPHLREVPDMLERHMSDDHPMVKKRAEISLHQVSESRAVA